MFFLILLRDFSSGYPLVFAEMVPASRTEGGGGTGTHLLSAKVRKTIQSIKEIVGNHSEADIYVALKETNMDPNETTQKLLNQGWIFVGL